jgi:hypothetical protein
MNHIEDDRKSGNIPCADGLEKSTLLKCPYYAKQVADSTQFSSKYQ